MTTGPFLGHFGIGGLPHGESLLGMFLKKEGIETRIATAIGHVDDGALVLADGATLRSPTEMVVPPFLGQEFLPRAGGHADEKGYVRVRDTDQSQRYDDVYAVGVPKTGLPTAVMAHTAVNIAAQVRGHCPPGPEGFGDIKAICVKDAGNNGAIIVADKMLPPRKHGVLTEARRRT